MAGSSLDTAQAMMLFVPDVSGAGLLWERVCTALVRAAAAALCALPTQQGAALGTAISK